MNPFRWARERQVAGAAICAIGGLLGVIFAWLDSPYRSLAAHSISGPEADYAGVFLAWLQFVHLYWPWPVLGVTIAGLSFYAAALLHYPKSG